MKISEQTTAQRRCYYPSSWNLLNPNSTHFQLLAALIFLATFVSRSLPENMNVSILTEMVSILLTTLASVQKAKSLPPAKSCPIAEPWEEPKPADHLFNNTRILWGFWDSGEAGMPDLSKQAVLSWRVRNPNWKVQILDNSNYQEFVSMSDLPSTYESLKVQHKSDLIRLAVLIRYGGIYMDASTLVYKSFDGIWETIESDQHLFLTSLNHLEEAEVDMFNNGLMMTRGIHNPVLMEWHQRMLAYHEAPALTYDEMKAHPSFSRVVHLWDDPSLGFLGDMIPYHSNLWLLNDMIWHDDLGLSHYVQHLPKLRWGFYFLSLPYLFDQVENRADDALLDPARDPPVVHWYASALVKSVWSHFMKAFSDDVSLANDVMDQMHVLKFTSHDMPFVDFGMTKIGLHNTLGRIFRAAYTTEEFPTSNATLRGVSPALLVKEPHPRPLADAQSSSTYR